jgi:phosphoribosylformylglycinamidine synthase subunit PurQ / glutaminase
VESGLVPGREPGAVDVALAPNRYAGRRGYFSRWVVIEKIAQSHCAFLEGLPDTLPMPIAHAEGRFTHRNPLEFTKMLDDGYLAFRYAGLGDDPLGTGNPNGSLLGTAAMTNSRGNVLAMMPHPERAGWLFQVPEDLNHPWADERRAAAGDSKKLLGDGPGMAIIRKLVELC